MEPRGEPAGDYGPEDADLLDRALKLLADVPGSDDILIGDALTSPYLGVKSRAVVAAAARTGPDVFTEDEQVLVSMATYRAITLAGWPRVLRWAAELTPAAARVAADPVTTPLRGSPGLWGVEDGCLFVDDVTVRYLEGIPPGEDWRVTDRGAGPQLQVDMWVFPLIPSGEVP